LRESKTILPQFIISHICWSTEIKLLSARLWDKPLLDQEPHDHQSGLRLWSCFHSNSKIRSLSSNQFQFNRLIFLPKVVARYTLEDEPLSMPLCSVQFRSNFQITKLLPNMLSSQSDLPCSSFFLSPQDFDQDFVLESPLKTMGIFASSLQPHCVRQCHSRRLFTA
jgi:hypothetical protein